MRKIAALLLVITLLVPSTGFAVNLSPPKNLTIRATSPTALTLYWKSAPGVKKYEVYVKSGSKWKKITATAKLTYTHKALKAGTKYSYRVRSVSGKSMSSYTNKAATTPKKGALNGPKISFLKQVDNGVCITWKKLSDIDSMEVYRSTDKVTYKKIASIKTETFYIDTRAPENKTIHYVLRASNSKGFGSYGNIKSINNSASIPTAAPTISPTAVPTAVPTTQPTDSPDDPNIGTMVWIPKTGAKYHQIATCSNMKNPSEVTLTYALEHGYERCLLCW